MRLGIFGGTFDPVHFGHLLLAEACREQLRLDEVWFLPAAVPPHKQHQKMADGEDRAEMLKLATGGHSAFRVCRHEIDRGGVNFTVDTLDALKRQDPSREMLFLLGADALCDFPTWKDPARLCQLAMPAVVRRAQSPIARDEDPLDLTALAALLPSDVIEAIRRHQVEMPRIDLTSSDIRRRVAAGLSIRFRTPRAVEKYIEAGGLYRGAN